MNFIRIVLLLAFSCLVYLNAWAGEQVSKNVLDQRFNFFGGIQVYQADGEFRSIKDGRPDVEVDLDDLNLDENNVSPIFGAHFNFGKRWTLRLDYFGYHDDANASADFSFDFDDITIPVGARIDSSLDLDVYSANLAYNFYQSQRARFGFGVGVHMADIDLEISGKVIVDGQEIPLGAGDADLLAPLPNLYAYGVYGFTDKFILRYGGGWMSLSYGDFSGSLYLANAYLEYWPFKHFGFGVGYRYVAADIEYDPGNKTEEYDVKLPGPVLYVAIGF